MNIALLFCVLCTLYTVFGLDDTYAHTREHGSQHHTEEASGHTPMMLKPRSKKRYDGFEVVRVQFPTQNTTDTLTVVRMLQSVAELQGFDVWTTNLQEGWMDVMLPKSMSVLKTSLFLNLPNKVQIEDVQQLLDENERERQRSRVPTDFFSDFQTYGAIADWLELQVQNSTSTTVKRLTIGSTYQGTHIYGLSMTKSSDPRPVFVVQCGIHAREWVSPTTCCWIIDRLLNHDPDGGQLLNTFEFIVIPVLNVDGYDYSHTADRLWRKNRQPNTGSSCVGTDLNRNYGFSWGTPGGSNNPCAETYWGREAFSGPETAALRDFLEDIEDEGRLISYFDIHSYSALWMSPWGYTCQSFPPDYTLMRNTMQAATTALQRVNGRSYRFGAICPTIYQSSGSSIDYTYGDLGVVHSYAVECYGSSFTPPPSWIPVIGSEVYAGVKATAMAISQELREENM